MREESRLSKAWVALWGGNSGGSLLRQKSKFAKMKTAANSSCCPTLRISRGVPGIQVPGTYVNDDICSSNF